MFVQDFSQFQDKTFLYSGVFSAFLIFKTSQDKFLCLALQKYINSKQKQKQVNKTIRTVNKLQNNW